MDDPTDRGPTSRNVVGDRRGSIVNTEDASLGHVIEQAQVVKLPLNGRSFMELATLVPGVNAGPPGDYRAYVHGYAPSANGARPEFNSYYMDGTDNNDAFSFTFNVTPSIDSVEEFKVQTGMFSAEFGRAAGAVVNLVTRSGTNAFHGSLFEFFRNDKLDARLLCRSHPAQGSLSQESIRSLGGRTDRTEQALLLREL